MTTKTDGGPAFPMPAGHVPNVNVHEWNRPHYGMTLRDHFAGLAMQAAATNPTGAEGFTFEQRAEWAYSQADAMIKTRKTKS